MPSTEVVAATRTGEGVGVGEEPERSLGRSLGPSMELTQFHSNDNLNKQSTLNAEQAAERAGNVLELFSQPSSCCVEIFIFYKLFSIIARGQSKIFPKRLKKIHSVLCVELQLKRKKMHNFPRTVVHPFLPPPPPTPLQLAAYIR